MTRKELTIWLVGLLSVGPIGGLSTVICYGADGNIGIELYFHNHCRCPEGDTTETAEEISIFTSQSHNHCLDIPINPTAVITKTRNNSLIYTANFGSVCQYGIQYNSSAYEYSFSQTPIFESYFSPLRTIILLV
jgi:hypothetical protein